MPSIRKKLKKKIAPYESTVEEVQFHLNSLRREGFRPQTQLFKPSLQEYIIHFGSEK